MRWFLSVILFLIVGITQAQDADYWYYVVDDVGTLYGYNTADGEIRTLATDFYNPSFPMRIDDERILISTETSEGVYTLHLITPTDVYILASDLNSLLYPGGYDAPYVVLSSYGIDAAAFVINLETLDIITLPIADTRYIGICCTLNEETLYYVTPTEEAFQLKKLNLQTMEEETLFSTEAYVGTDFQTTQDSRFWLVNVRQSVGRIFVLIDTESGEIKPLEEGLFYRIFDDYLVTYSISCQEDCIYTVTNLTTGEAYDYMASTEQPTPFKPVDVDEGIQFITYASTALIRTSPQGPAEILGYSTFMFGNAISPDKQWYALYDSGGGNPQHVMIWHIDADQPVFQQEIVDTLLSYRTIFQDEYFILENSQDTSLSVIVNMDTSELHELTSLNMIDATIMGTIAHHQLLVINNETPDAGLYLYDWETGEQTLIREGQFKSLQGLLINEFPQF